MSGGEEDHAREDDHGLGESQYASSTLPSVCLLMSLFHQKHARCRQETQTQRRRLARRDARRSRQRSQNVEWITGCQRTRLVFIPCLSLTDPSTDTSSREDLDSQFHTKIRELLTNVLGPVAPRQQSQHKRSSSNSSDDDDDQAAKARPGYEHAQLLFAKSEDLIKYYNRVEKKMGEARVDLVTEQLETFEKEKGEIAELLHCGQEVARRRVQSVLKRPDDKEVQKKRKGRYTKGELDETADMFDVLKKERLQENQTRGEGEEDLEMDVAEGMGLWEVIHDAKKGVKKLAGHLILGEDE